MSCTYCNRDHAAKDCPLPRGVTGARGMEPVEAIRLLRAPQSTLTDADCARIANTIEAMQRELSILRQPELKGLRP